MLPVIYRGHEDAGFFALALGLTPGKSPIEFLPGNHPTRDARYACLIAVRDYFRMRGSEAGAGAWHYSRIEPEILDDVRAGRALLVFDLCNEGPAYEPEIFSELYDWIGRERIPAGRCVWLAQNRAAAADARAQAGSRAELVRFEYYDYFVKIMAWLFSRSGTDNFLRADPQTYLTRLFDASRKDKLLLCLNATPRLPRILTVAALQHHRLIEPSLVSFPGMHYVKSGASLEQVLEFVRDNPQLEYLRDSVEGLRHMPRIKVDDFSEQGNALVEKIDPGVYERTFFSLVTESDFADEKIARVTEKTVKSYCMGHPTLVVGNSGSVDFMREFGFEDWDAVFDRSADGLTDPASRFERVFADLLRQMRRIENGPQAWLDSVKEVGARNFQYAVSGSFLADYVRKTDTAIVARLAAGVGS